MRDTRCRQISPANIGPYLCPQGWRTWRSRICERYFADRADVDPFAWARANLAEAQTNQAKRFTVP